jgi:hypothetical protein
MQKTFHALEGLLRNRVYAAAFETALFKHWPDGADVAPCAGGRFDGDLFADLKLIDEVGIAGKFLKGTAVTTFGDLDFDPSFKAGVAASGLAGDFLELDAGDRTACVEVHRD